MAILNANTKIDEHKTIGEIQQLLASKGAQSIMVDYEAGAPVALKFQIVMNGTYMPFALPARFDGVRKVMLESIKSGLARRRKEADKTFVAQSRRVAWRILKVWIAAQMALVEAGQAEIAEVFLPYLSQGSQTLFEKLQSNPSYLALGTGD